MLFYHASLAVENTYGDPKHLTYQVQTEAVRSDRLIVCYVYLNLYC
jgi:hypothetical protein